MSKLTKAQRRVLNETKLNHVYAVPKNCRQYKTFLILEKMGYMKNLIEGSRQITYKKIKEAE